MDTRIRRLKTLLIGDAELSCDCDKITIEDLNITHIGLNLAVLDEFELIIYNGNKGTKILKSTYTKTGIIK